jgi:hypothetical protein
MSSTPILLALLLLAQSPSQPSQRPKETFWQKVLRLTGISAMPSTSKGLRPEETAGGDLWVATADGASRLRLTRDGGYQSPIFDAEGGAVLALHEGKLVRVSTAGFLDPEPLFAVPEVVRLIGVDREAPGQVVVLTRTAEGATGLGLLDLKDPRDRQVHSLGTGATAAEVKDAVAKLARWDRTWQVGEPPRGVSLTVRAAGRGSDVLCQSDGAAAVDVSRCAGDRCGQPALSADGRKVVFVRARPS